MVPIPDLTKVKTKPTFLIGSAQLSDWTELNSCSADPKTRFVLRLPLNSFFLAILKGNCLQLPRGMSWWDYKSSFLLTHNSWTPHPIILSHHFSPAAGSGWSMAQKTPAATHCVIWRNPQSPRWFLTGLPRLTLVVENLPANAADIRHTGSILELGRYSWRRAQQPTPVFLTGESHGQRSLADHSL